MQVQITKRADGAGVLRCVRSDGSVSWQKQTDRHSAFFALHDLTHFAVETTLGFNGGFFGLVAEGWDIDDTTGKGTRGPLPQEALMVESMVGLFFTEQSSGANWTVDDFNEALANHLRTASIDGPLSLTSDQIGAVRKCMSKLFELWASVPIGQSLELAFVS